MVVFGVQFFILNKRLNKFTWLMPFKRSSWAPASNSLEPLKWHGENAGERIRIAARRLVGCRPLALFALFRELLILKGVLTTQFSFLSERQIKKWAFFCQRTWAPNRNNEIVNFVPRLPLPARTSFEFVWLIKFVFKPFAVNKYQTDSFIDCC